MPTGKTSSTNRFPLRVIAIASCFLFASVAPVMESVDQAGRISNTIIGWGATILLFFVLRSKVRKRLQEERVEAQFDPAVDPFVLYIRSFDMETDIFAIARMPGSASFLRMRTFDQYLSSGYRVEVKDPGAGAVIGFEQDGRAVVLRAGCRTPEEYLEAASINSRALYSSITPIRRH